MKYIISGTNRPGSRSRQISNVIQEIYRNKSEMVEIIDLAELPYEELTGQQYGASPHPSVKWNEVLKKVESAEGLIFVIPEYNGSYPGALKYFVDHWKYPEAFEYRPICYVGLGGMFGGLRPVEHFQQVMGYRNAFQFPNRIFLMNIFKTLQNGKIEDPNSMKLLEEQAEGFQKFVKGLVSQGIDANSVNAKRPVK